MSYHYCVHNAANKQFAGAEIFAKRRKRSEKWVVDQEQPQTPNTPTTPKTPIYPEKPASCKNIILIHSV
jgi:hypothetical protein